MHFTALDRPVHALPKVAGSKLDRRFERDAILEFEFQSHTLAIAFSVPRGGGCRS
jgi:hypothetical protein